MNLNPFRSLRAPFGRKGTDPTRNQGGLVARATHDAQSMGPWSGVLGQWMPRNAEPWLYEALREAVPVLDGGIERLVTLDGIVDVEGDNDRLVDEIREWMDNVPVNDVESGYQAFYASLGNEHYEQGIGAGEFVYEPKGRDVVGLRVADSKGVLFVRDTDRLRIYYLPPGTQVDHRPDGLGTVEALLRGEQRRAPGTTVGWAADNGYVELDPAQLVLAVHRPEADNPYGTSILRSLPFVAQILLKMQNSTARAWERFGDPIFHVKYATKNRQIDGKEALARANRVVGDLGAALASKAKGNSVDIATGTGADDEITIGVVGADGEAFEIEMPARHMLEQVVAKFGLAPWTLGLTWGQQSGIGEQQSVVMLQESMTRFERRRPGLERPVLAMLRARGRTWKPGDWRLVQRLPNLMDETKRAQAEFLRAQTALMLRESGQVDEGELGGGIDNGLRSPRARSRTKGVRGTKATDDDSEGEAWAESDPKLPRLERSLTKRLLDRWHALRGSAFDILGLSQPSAASFAFDLAQMAALMSAGESAAQGIAGDLLDGQTTAWGLGIEHAADDLGVDMDAAVDEALALLRETARTHYTERGMSLVRNGLAREYREQIVAQLAGGAYDGQNPVNVARALRQQFDLGDYNWERLARSEIAWAQSEGKLALMRQQGVSLYDYTTAEDGKVSQICLSLAAAGPYRVDDPASPLPLRDSHPNCRCSIVSRA